MASPLSAVASTTRLSWEDILIVVLYFLAVVAVGLWASCRASRNTVSGYFLAGRSMWFYTVGASLFVSNIGSEHFIGLAGSGAAGGIGVGAWEFNAIFFLQLLGFVFVPVYIACQTYTMPEYLNKRFGGQRIRVYFALLSLVLYIFTKCSVNLYTGAIFIQQSLGWDLYLSIVLQIGVVAVLTITGGLTAVIYTDTLQAVLMVGGALALMGKGFYDIGGFNELWRQYPMAVTNYTVPNTTCHEVNPYWNVMLRGPSDPEMPWPGFIFGQSPSSIWYWCSDQVIVQRALAAKSLSHAQGAAIMAAFIKILPLFMMVMPGMMARVFFTDEVACVDPEICWSVCQSRSGCTNIAYPKLVLGIMPKGARGIMMAVMLAALMSDLDSIFNSASTLFTIDVYKRIRKKAGTKELMVVGRLFVVVMVGVAVAWVPVVKETQGGQVFIYIQEVTIYLAPPVACIYLLAVLWPRCNEQGAFWGLMSGFVTGVVRLILVFVYPGPDQCGQVDTRPSFLRDFHYMYFAIMLFWLTCAVTVIVSLFTTPPSYRHLYRTTFWTRYDSVDKNDVVKDNVKMKWDRLFLCFDTSVHSQTQTQTYYTHDNPAMVDDVIEDGDVILVPGTKTSAVQCDLDIELQEIHTGDAAKTTTTTTTTTTTNAVIDDKTAALTADAAPKQPPNRSCKDFFISWLCGVNSGSDVIQDEADRVKDEAQEAKVSSLKQNKVAKIALYIMLVIILSIGVALLCFFSLWNYTVE